ncbi:glycosyltransferase family 4 protein [Paracoccus aerodenitrificans]|uniref:glycosyltransferase family 4 protein n=1 Tax=Paracoccus aerodenitrificans TaxID=3017781 RepID=UPI0022F082CD|nr:glycosyltransferase family 1 protein [Paracoccus aerodenitrificans]WBU63966.1 glycosyltransferase family 1 protein [Paracoccus aerodenitrificans]
MAAEPAAILDVSRLVSRIGTGPLTGIDRVEAAWLRHLADRPCLLLCRIPRGQALLPAEAAAKILQWSDGDLSDFAQSSGWRETLAKRRGIARRAQEKLRRMAHAVLPVNGRGIRSHIARHLPAAEFYLNVGHSNLLPKLLHNLAGLKRAIMIHDTIPLDHPEFCRTGQPAKFRDRFMTALNMADLVIAISEATAGNIEIWRRRLAITRSAPIIVAPIGTDLTDPDPSTIPVDLDLSHPFFVTLGTIEPRKNHALLLDVWEQLAKRLKHDQIPRLLIIGRRGWENHDVFARLDALPRDAAIIEMTDLPDSAVATLVMRCRALLMPSRAEGFGLPLTEAAGRGTPVICAPLPVAQELLGNYPIYLSSDDVNGWTDKIIQLIGENTAKSPPLEIPAWTRHFKIVEGALNATQD